MLIMGKKIKKLLPKARQERMKGEDRDRRTGNRRKGQEDKV